MSGDREGRGRTKPDDVLATIAQFRDGRIRLSTLLERTWAQIHDLDPRTDLDLALLEDLWTDLEIIYAQASDTQRFVLDEGETRRVEHIVNALASVLGDST